MLASHLWQDPDFPHFYHNPVIGQQAEAEFASEVSALEQILAAQTCGFGDVLTEEIVANSEIEGVLLDRESVHSSFVKNLTPIHEKEQGAVELTKLALANFDKDLSHDFLAEMHRTILKGSTFPPESIGTYVGDMEIVISGRLDRDDTLVHRGIPHELAHAKMTEFIHWFNTRPSEAPLVNAIQGHLHFETLHPFCDGNGRIGRSLMLMSLCRDLGHATPFALSRAFQKDLKTYYHQFRTSLDLTPTIQLMKPLFVNAVRETEKILQLTAYRSRISDQSATLNPRQIKVLNRLVDDELKGGFEGGMSNGKYQKMAGISDRTALRDLDELHQRELLTKTGQRKGTRYDLKLSHFKTTNP